MKAKQQGMRALPASEGGIGADISTIGASALMRKTTVTSYIVENIKASGKDPVRTLVGFFLAWTAFCLLWKVIPAPAKFSVNGMTVLAIVIWACIMWVSEALPVGITGIGIPTHKSLY